MSEELSLDALRQALDRILKAESAVAAVYLYGSRVAGRVLPSSDLDRSPCAAGS